jgi:SAM-dependent methyltransferase
MSSPDQNALGLLDGIPEPLRYETTSEDPDDVAWKVASLIPRRGRVLDVGCGTGSTTQIISRLTGLEVLGVEPDEQRRSVAASRGVKIAGAYLTAELAKEIGPFETIVFADVLEHLPSPGDLIQTAKTALSPGGSIVASVPNVAHWTVRFDLLRGRFQYADCGIMDATHLRWFTANSIESLFSKFGFVVTEHLYTVNYALFQNRGGLPFKLFGENTRKRILSALVRSYPRMFGCQHVIRAELRFAQ